MRVLLMIGLLILGCNTYAQESSKIKVLDTRSIVPLPTDYNREVRIEFKMRSSVNVPGSGYYSGLMTIAPWSDNSGGKHHQLNFNNGGFFYRSAYPESATWENWRQILMTDENHNVGIGTNSPAAKLDLRGSMYVETNSDAILTFNNTDNSWQFFQFMQSGIRKTWMGLNTQNDFCITKESGGDIVLSGANVGIGTGSPMFTLDVNGTIRSTEIKVQAQTADFIFEDDYQLKELSEVEQFITTNKHLPDIPSAKQMEEEGVGLAEMNKLLLQKVEELTLYAIELEKRDRKKAEKLEKLEEELELVKKLILKK